MIARPGSLSWNGCWSSRDGELPDLDASFPLPPAPWFALGAVRSVRRTIVHIVAETAQHAGHADIIRETIDGAKTMG